MTHSPPLTGSELTERLRREGQSRYHDRHPFHLRMHEGKLSREELQRWVLNRYYYQTRIPIKDAIIISKSEDPSFRRRWVRRIIDHDGGEAGQGGLALWLRLAEGVGLDPEEVVGCRRVLAGVRLACDGYVSLVRERSLVEAVASSLTELFAPDLLARRVLAWERHYRWVSRETLEYFRSRPPKARHDAEEALDFVLQNALTRELQELCIDALVRKTEILWSLLDCVEAAEGGPRGDQGDGGGR